MKKLSKRSHARAPGMTMIAFGCPKELKADLEELAFSEKKTLSRFIVQQLEDVVMESENHLIDLRSKKLDAFTELSTFADKIKSGAARVDSEPYEVFALAKKHVRAVSQTAKTPYAKSITNEIRDLFSALLARKDGRDPQNIIGDIDRAMGALETALSQESSASRVDGLAPPSTSAGKTRKGPTLPLLEAARTRKSKSSSTNPSALAS